MDRETLVNKVRKEYEDAGTDMSEVSFLFISDKKRDDIVQAIGYKPAMFGGIQAISMSDKLWMIPTELREKAGKKLVGI